MTSRAHRRRNHKLSTISKAKEPKTEGQVIEIKRGQKTEDQTLLDGLVLMLRKKRITGRRFTAAIEYRIAYREPQEGPMRSCLDDSPRGSGQGSEPMAGYNAGKIDAMRQLFTFRHVVLGGNSDLIEAMDGIAGGGNNARTMAGGNGHKALAIEKVFFIACDLIAQHLDAKQPQQARA